VGLSERVVCSRAVGWRRVMCVVTSRRGVDVFLERCEGMSI